MIDNLKKILLDEIAQDIDEYNRAKNRINEIDNRIEELNMILGWHIKEAFGEEADESITLKEPDEPQFIIKKFSFLQKHLFNRKQYLYIENHNKQLQDKYEKEMEEYKQNQDELNLELKNLISEKDELIKVCESKEEFKQRFDIIKNAKTLKDLNLTFEEVKTILQEHGINFVLDECDKTIIVNESEFDSEEDFILVHKTMYSPKNDIVMSQKSAGATEEDTVYFMDDLFTIKYEKTMDTIHFCQNGEVSSHEYGNFEKRKYAVLIPLINIDKKNLISFNPEDTFFTGSISTQGGYILCPENEVEVMKKSNPNTIIVGYKGDFVDGYADAFLSMIGYRQEDVSKHSWAKASDQKKHDAFIKNNSKYHYNFHDGSIENYIAKLTASYNRIIGFVKSLKEYIDKEKKYNIEMFIYQIFNCNNKTKFKSGIQEKTFEKNLRIVPSIIDMLSRGIYIYEEPHKQLFLKDYVDEAYVDDKTDAKESNLKFLLFNLKKNFDIDISPEIIDLLNENENQKIESFCNLISNETLRKLIIKMLDNKIINNLSEVKDVVFIYNIVVQLYKKKEFEQDNTIKKI